MFDFLRPAKKKAIDELAQAMASDFMERFPVDGAKDWKNRKATRKLTSAVDALCSRALTFHRDAHLDVYGKARLNNNLLWALREAGYDADFIDEITKQVIISLNAKPVAS